MVETLLRYVPCAEEEERRKMLTPSKRYRIILIDDVLVNLQTIRGFLQNAYELSLLTSVRQALLYLKRQTEPDLIILDMDMSEMSGIEAAAKIKALVGEEAEIKRILSGQKYRM